jgi:mRNA interferase MazF
MTCKPGELVGIPFPFSDLATRKRRPVLVLTHPDRHGDFMGLAVTSVSTQEFAVGIDDKSLTEGHLPRPSWVRCDKIFTLSETNIVRTYGSLDSRVLGHITELLCTFLGCKEPDEPVNASFADSELQDHG